ncbi:MAG: GGDEF domain-containing protein [Myxococcales bacterium]|nr:GGDEF domain-containing protein [Myxococcales bacterium]
MDAPSRERWLLALLYQLGQRISGGAPLEDLLAHIAEAACELSSAESASVMLLDDKRRQLLCAASYGLSDAEAAAARFALGEGLAGWVAEHGEPATVGDTSRDPRFVEVVGQQPARLRSLCCVPMFARSGLIGVVTIGSPELDRFSADDEELLGYMAAAVAKDVENGRLYRLAITDALTGLYNRQHVGEKLPQEIARHRRYQQPLSLLLLDADHFKQVNDRHGHDVGDEVLRGLAQRLRESTRDADIVARYGGEEFMVLLPNTAEEGAENLAERLRAAVRDTPIAAAGVAVSMTLSAGLVTLGDGENAEALVKRADQALYRAKNSGRDRIEIG